MNKILALLFLGTITVVICANSKRERHHKAAAVKHQSNQQHHLRHARENEYDDETYEDDTGNDEDFNEDAKMQRRKRATNPDDSEVLTEIDEQDSNDQLFPINDDAVETYEDEEPNEEAEK